MISILSDQGCKREETCMLCNIIGILRMPEIFDMPK